MVFLSVTVGICALQLKKTTTATHKSAVLRERAKQLQITISLYCFGRIE